VYAGTFDLKDGVRTIIEGFLRFNKLYNDTVLLLVGKSDQQTRFQEEFKDCNDIVFMGYVPDKEFYSLLREADVLCMCRTNSGFSNAGFPFKLGEYLATGNPVIATRASDVCDYLTSEDAYLVDFDSPESIATALQRIVENPDEAQQVGLNGFLKYQKHFSPESNGKLMLDLLMNL
jgi:glycosyltransferase involved in cell wall biosynthesis